MAYARDTTEATSGLRVASTLDVSRYAGACRQTERHSLVLSGFEALSRVASHSKMPFKLLETTFQQPTTANETRQSIYQAPADTSPDAPRTVTDRLAESSS
jgi:hypothetical protein